MLQRAELGTRSTKSHREAPQESKEKAPPPLGRPSPHCILTLPEMSVWELTSRYCFGSGKPELSRELLLDHRSE